MSQLSLFKGLVGRVSVLLVFAVGAVGLFLMMGGLGEGQEGQEAPERPVEKLDYQENGTATVVAYIGDDPEGQTVTWSLGGGRCGGLRDRRWGADVHKLRRTMRIRSRRRVGLKCCNGTYTT